MWEDGGEIDRSEGVYDISGLTGGLGRRDTLLYCIGAGDGVRIMRRQGWDVEEKMKEAADVLGVVKRGWSARLIRAAVLPSVFGDETWSSIPSGVLMR